MYKNKRRQMTPSDTKVRLISIKGKVYSSSTIKIAAMTPNDTRWHFSGIWRICAEHRPPQKRLSVLYQFLSVRL